MKARSKLCVAAAFILALSPASRAAYADLPSLVDEDGIVEIRWPMLLQRKFSEECTELSVAASEGDVDQIDFMLESLLDNLRASIRDCRPWEYIAAK